MNQQQLLLTQLLCSKELTFGCEIEYDGGIHTIINYPKDISDFKVCFDGNYTRYPRDTEFEIIGHPANLSDLHRWMNLHGEFQQNYTVITFTQSSEGDTEIPYDSSKNLLEQSTETLAQIIELITNNQ